MENSDNFGIRKEGDSASDRLEKFFLQSLQEIYYAEVNISRKYDLIKDEIESADLQKILKIHFGVHLKHQERLIKVFEMRGETPTGKNCDTFDAIIREGSTHLNLFAEDIANWEIALVLLSQKFSHFKIASYGGLAHLAIKLNYYNAAALLAFCVQEEEEYIAENLDALFNTFLAKHVEGYKN